MNYVHFVGRYVDTFKTREAKDDGITARSLKQVIVGRHAIQMADEKRLKYY